MEKMADLCKLISDLFILIDKYKEHPLENTTFIISIANSNY